jgi:hypothetical protein
MSGPGTNLNVRMMVGVTTDRAAAVRVTFARGYGPLTLNTIGNASFPRLRFFVSDVPITKIAAIEALDKAGKPLFQVDPGTLA